MNALHDALAAAWPLGTVTAVRVLSQRRSASRRRDPHPLRLRLELDWQDGGSCGTQRLAGKSWRDGGSAAAYAVASRANWMTPAAGPALLHLPTLDMLLWAWPNDPAMPQLPQLLDPAAWPGGGTCVEMWKHVPEDRATLVCGEVVGKTFADDRAAILHERFARLHRSGDDVLRVAAPRGHDAALRVLWQARVQGTPLRDVADPVAGAAALGRAVAALHDAGLPTEAARPRAHWQREIGRRAVKIGRAQPALAARVRALADALEARAALLPEAPPVAMHGDLHADQAWLDDGGRVLLFDLDEVAIGDPMEDLAAFVVKADGVLPAAAAESFVAAYRAAAPRRWRIDDFAWHAAVQQLLQSARAFVFQVPDWPQVLARRLALAEELMR